MNEIDEGGGKRREPMLEKVDRPALADAATAVTGSRPAPREPAYSYVLAVESPDAEPGLTVREFALVFLRSWWIIALVTAACLGLAVVSLLEANPIYTATMVVKSAEDQLSTNAEPGDASGLLTILGLGSGTTTKVSIFDVFLNTLASVRLADRLDRKHALLKRLFAQEWDEQARQWRAPAVETAGPRARVREFFGLPVWAPPSAVSLTKHLADITQIPSTTPGIVVLEYENEDRDFAKWFLETTVAEADGLLREQARTEISANLEYILQKLDEVWRTEYRAVFIQIQAQLETSLMLIRSNASYAADIVDGPFVSDLPTSPRITQTLAIAMAIGLVLGALSALFVHLLRPPRRRAR